MFKSRYYKKVKEYTEEEKQAYREQKEKERLENNTIIFTLEKKYSDDFVKYLNIDKAVLVAEFQYRADKVAAVKSLNSKERIVYYDPNSKCWIIELNKINIEDFKKIFSDFNIIINLDTVFTRDIIKENWEILSNLLDINKSEESIKYKKAIESLIHIA